MHILNRYSNGTIDNAMEMVAHAQKWKVNTLENLYIYNNNTKETD
jgi:hypothetical protein